MERKQRFYRCPHCGNIIAKLNDSGVSVVCCGEKMIELECNTVDGVGEKHVPVYKVDKGKVSVDVGSLKHPMMPEHYIQWIWIKTKNGSQVRHLKPSDAPSACFSLCDGDELEEVYAYCNIHGLWNG